MTTLPNSREEAIKLGATRYRSEKPCKNGHHVRQTCNQQCVECGKAHWRNWRSSNIEQHRDRERRYHERDRKGSRERARDYQRRNPSKVAGAVCARQKRVRIATPPCADLAVIRAFYKNRPIGHHVDHIVPIKGELVCGLHVEWNLQYLPATENIKKRNRHGI